MERKPKQQADSPGSDISPKSPAPKQPSRTGYFPSSGDADVAGGSSTSGKASDGDGSSGRKSIISFVNELVVKSPAVDGTQENMNEPRRPIDRRKSSASSVTFLPARSPSLPQGKGKGKQKQTDSSRIRASSPPHERYVSHDFFFASAHIIWFFTNTPYPCILRCDFRDKTWSKKRECAGERTKHSSE